MLPEIDRRIGGIMRSPYLQIVLALAALAGIGCGGSTEPENNQVIERRVSDLMENAGRAIIDKNWQTLASLHSSESDATAESLEALFTSILADKAPLTEVVATTWQRGSQAEFQEWVASGHMHTPLESLLGRANVILGNGTDPNVPAFDGIVIDTFVGEEDGQYLLLGISSITSASDVLDADQESP